MIYLDYAANTPTHPDVMEAFVKENNQFIANPNASHRLGREAKERLDQITAHIAEMLQISPPEIIYTSGASEANNLAIKGLVQAYRYNGKHIISTGLEHSSVSGALTHLQSIGYEIDLVDINKDGLVDLEHLRELLRQDTVLVSICSVDSELGIRQPIPEIGTLLREYPNCYFHTDATQAVGKIPVSFENVDLCTFAPHKFYGLNGCGILFKRQEIVLEPIIHGGSSTTVYRSGTPTLGLIASTEKALELCLKEQAQRYEYIAERKEELVGRLKKYQKVRVNSTINSIPHIINISVQGVKALLFQQELEKYDVMVSTKSACSVPNAPSRPVYAVTKDKKNAMCSWRISLSHLTTREELEQFMGAFHDSYEGLTGDNPV